MTLEALPELPGPTGRSSSSRMPLARGSNPFSNILDGQASSHVEGIKMARKPLLYYGSSAMIDAMVSGQTEGQQKKKRLEWSMADELWLMDLRMVYFMALPKLLTEAIPIMRLRSKALLASYNQDLDMEDLLFVASSKAEVRLHPPVTRKQQRVQQDYLATLFVTRASTIQAAVLGLRLDHQEPSGFFEAWFMNQVLSHPQAADDDERQLDNLFWVPSDHKRCLQFQGLLARLPGLHDFPELIIAALTNILVQSESILAGNPRLYDQLISILAECWLIGVLPTSYVVNFFSSDRLRGFASFAFYKSLGQLFLGLLSRCQDMVTPGTITKLLSSPGSPGPASVKENLLPGSAYDRRSLLCFEQVDGLMQWLGMETLPTDILGQAESSQAMFKASFVCWCCVRHRRKTVPTAMVKAMGLFGAYTWRDMLTKCAEIVTSMWMMDFICGSFAAAFSVPFPPSPSGINDLDDLCPVDLQASGLIDVLADELMELISGYIDKMPSSLCPINSPALLEALAHTARRHAFLQKELFHQPAHQPSRAGLLFESVLIKLVQQKHLTTAAACGIVWLSYTHKCTSLAMTDLHSARFLINLLSLCSKDTSRQQRSSAIQALYTSSGVSLVQLIPQDLLERQDWLDLYLSRKEMQHLMPLILEQLKMDGREPPAPASQYDPVDSMLCLRARLFHYHQAEKPTFDAPGINCHWISDSLHDGRSTLGHQTTYAGLFGMEFTSSSWPRPPSAMLYEMAARTLVMAKEERLPAGHEIFFAEGMTTRPVPVKSPYAKKAVEENVRRAEQERVRRAEEESVRKAAQDRARRAEEAAAALIAEEELEQQQLASKKAKAKAKKAGKTKREKLAAPASETSIPLPSTADSSTSVSSDADNQAGSADDAANAEVKAERGGLQNMPADSSNGEEDASRNLPQPDSQEQPQLSRQTPGPQISDSVDQAVHPHQAVEGEASQPAQQSGVLAAAEAQLEAAIGSGQAPGLQLAIRFAVRTLAAADQRSTSLDLVKARLIRPKGMATPTTDKNAATLIANSFKSPPQVCWSSLAYIWRLIGTGAMLQDVAARWPQSKLPSQLVQEELREFGLPSQRPVAYLEAWFMHQFKSHPRSKDDFERQTDKVFWADQNEDWSRKPGHTLLVQDMLGLLPTLQENPAWVLAAVTAVWANAETLLVSNPLLHEQLLTFLEKSWLMGTLSIDSIADLFSSMRLCSFKTFPFYQTVAQLFVQFAQRSEVLTTPATVEKLLSGSQLSPHRMLTHIFLHYDQDDRTKLLHFWEAHGLTAWLNLDPVPAADTPTEMLKIYNTMSTAWHILRTPTQDVAVAPTWRRPIEELANKCIAPVMQLFVTNALDLAIAGIIDAQIHDLRAPSIDENRQLKKDITAFLLAFLDAMPQVLVPRNSPALLEALHTAAVERSFSQPLRYHPPCTMHSQAGLLFEHVLCGLVNRQYLTMAAACGLVRAAYTDPCTSLAMTDLRTARFFLWMLSKGAAGSRRSANQTDLARMYTCSDVSLAQLLPRDLCAHREWLDLYLKGYEGIKHLVLQQLPKYDVKPARQPSAEDKAAAEKRAEEAAADLLREVEQEEKARQSKKMKSKARKTSKTARPKKASASAQPVPTPALTESEAQPQEDKASPAQSDQAEQTGQAAHLQQAIRYAVRSIAAADPHVSLALMQYMPESETADPYLGFPPGKIEDGRCQNPAAASPEPMSRQFTQPVTSGTP
ncbi:hypothetical protein WJX84_003666 [Apatococcus fuscideae]|uniref:Uncharacterized protein n=1 Tax=Apatococcus fuscideae TaxID=2026836 RepID=A0AAW1STK2_9CHLO